MKPGAKIPSPSPFGQPTHSLIFVRTTCSISVKTGAISYVNLLTDGESNESISKQVEFYTQYPAPVKHTQGSITDEKE
jgi:hypothetical protein